MTKRGGKTKITQPDETGDKSSRERTVSSVPSSKKNDPKTDEPRGGDMSTRAGGRGKNPPTGMPRRRA
jgi:hypothetical protein